MGAEEKRKQWEAELAEARAFLKEAFDKYDTDGSGAFEAEELGNLMRNELCEPVTEEEIGKALLEMDTDGNGKVEFEEFVAWFVRLSKRSDRENAKIRMLRLQLRTLRQ